MSDSSFNLLNSSISIRLQRSVQEEAYISVPITEELLKETEEGHQHPEITWMLEQIITLQPHPIQKAPPHVSENL
jgi:hypothetical protein